MRNEIFALAAGLFLGGSALDAGAAKVGVVDPCPMQGEAGAELPYVQALRQTGHLPVLIPWTTNGTEVAAQLQRVQLVLFLGGEDVAPRRYGEAKSPRCEAVNDRRRRPFGRGGPSLPHRCGGAVGLAAYVRA